MEAIENNFNKVRPNIRRLVLAFLTLHRVTPIVTSINDICFSMIIFMSLHSAVYFGK